MRRACVERFTLVVLFFCDPLACVLGDPQFATPTGVAWCPSPPPEGTCMVTNDCLEHFSPRMFPLVMAVDTAGSRGAGEGAAVGMGGGAGGKDRPSSPSTRSHAFGSSVPAPPAQPKGKSTASGSRPVHSARPGSGISNNSVGAAYQSTFAAGSAYANGHQLRRSASPAPQRSASAQRASSAATSRSPSAGPQRASKRKWQGREWRQ